MVAAKYINVFIVQILRGQDVRRAWPMSFKGTDGCFEDSAEGLRSNVNLGLINPKRLWNWGGGYHLRIKLSLFGEYHPN